MGSYYVAQAGLNTWRSACLCLTDAGSKDEHCHEAFFFFFKLHCIFFVNGSGGGQKTACTVGLLLPESWDLNSGLAARAFTQSHLSSP